MVSTFEIITSTEISHTLCLLFPSRAQSVESLVFMFSSVRHSQHYGREEQEQLREQRPSQLPRQEEDEQPSQHSPPRFLPLLAGSAQEGVQQAQGLAQGTQREATTHCTRDASCYSAVLEAARI